MKIATCWSSLFLFASFCSSDVAAQSCLFGDPAAPTCKESRLIDGSVGQHVEFVGTYDDPSTASASCASTIGHMAWFQVTPDVSGPVTISTCHPFTAFDTVLEVFEGGNHACDMATLVGCVDDTFDDQCVNGCSSWGSTLTFNATAGVQYRFVVGSFNANSAACPLCLGVVVTIGEPCGEPPYGIACGVATPLPGSVGSHTVQVDAQDAVTGQDTQWSCATTVGKQQWFTFTPEVSGLASFTTCTAGTTYDTVVRALTGDCSELLLDVGCNDDTFESNCIVDCPAGTPTGSSVEFPVTAGVPYYIEVASYGNNVLECPLCLEAVLEIVDYCDTESSPPVTEITSPLDLSCACDVLPVIGTAMELDSMLDHFLLEYRSMTGTWNPIVSGNGPIPVGLLGQWDTTGLSEDWYFVRLSATNVCGLSSSVVRIVRLDADFDTLALRSPGPGATVGGTVCFDGTAWDQCFDHYTVRYRPVGGSYLPVNPAQPTYESTVLNDPLATWNTTGIPDGFYDTELAGKSTCGRQESQTATVFVDNTPPVAVITTPANCDDVDGLVTIAGTVADANLIHWSLSFSSALNNDWLSIASGAGNVINDTLALWDTSNLPPCAYALRLIAVDAAVVDCISNNHHRTEYITTVAIGWPGDFDSDGDGDVDLRDFQAFEGAFHGPDIP